MLIFKFLRKGFKEAFGICKERRPVTHFRYNRIKHSNTRLNTASACPEGRRDAGVRMQRLLNVVCSGGSHWSGGGGERNCCNLSERQVKNALRDFTRTVTRHPRCVGILSDVKIWARPSPLAPKCRSERQIIMEAAWICTWLYRVPLYGLGFPSIH